MIELKHVAGIIISTLIVLVIWYREQNKFNKEWKEYFAKEAKANWDSYLTVSRQWRELAEIKPFKKTVKKKRVIPKVPKEKRPSTSQSLTVT